MKSLVIALTASLLINIYALMMFLSFDPHIEIENMRGVSEFRSNHLVNRPFINLTQKRYECTSKSNEHAIQPSTQKQTNTDTERPFPKVTTTSQGSLKSSQVSDSDDQQENLNGFEPLRDLQLKEGDFAKDDEYFKKQLHYNVDEFGVSLEKYIFSIANMMSLSPAERAKKFQEHGIKTVFYMHKPYGNSTYGFGYDDKERQGKWPYVLRGCRRRDCFCTHTKDSLNMEDFDAIVCHGREIRSSDVPKVRKQHQRYIFFLLESPLYLFGLQPRKWKNFFNWTHTYRRDSEMWHPNGIINQFKKFPKSVKELLKEASMNITDLEKKSKSVAWFVSNCYPMSGRDQFAKELKKYIDVDIYGSCSNLRCLRNDYDACWKMIEEKYFFYFSAENSLCKDYVTEKVYNPTRKRLVPIVFGGGKNTSDYRHLPEHSIINALDYKSPKHLADFLIALKSNIKSYASYFWWKPYYNIWYNRDIKAHCELCDRLHLDKRNKVIKSLHKWYVKDAKCRPKWKNSEWKFYNK